MDVTELRKQTCLTEEVGDGTQMLAEKASKKEGTTEKKKEGDTEQVSTGHQRTTSGSPQLLLGLGRVQPSQTYCEFDALH